MAKKSKQPKQSTAKSEEATIGEVVTDKVRGKVHDVKKMFKRAGWLALAESVILGLLGIILVACPESALQVAAWVIGLGLIVLGAYKSIEYFAVRGVYDFANNGLLVGVVALLAGVVIIVFNGEIASFFRIIIGIWMVYAALTRMNTAIKMKAAKMSAWSYSLLMAALMMIVGLFILFNSGAVVSLIGGAMIVVAILGIVDDIMYLYRIDTFADAIERILPKH